MAPTRGSRSRWTSRPPRAEASWATCSAASPAVRRPRTKYDPGALAAESFTMRDGERTIRFGEGTAAEAPGLLSKHGFGDYTLLTTPRAAGSAPLSPARTLEVPPGLVDEISAALLPDAGDGPLVA